MPASGLVPGTLLPPPLLLLLPAALPQPPLPASELSRPPRLFAISSNSAWICGGALAAEAGFCKALRMVSTTSSVFWLTTSSVHTSTPCSGVPAVAVSSWLSTLPDKVVCTVSSGPATETVVPVAPPLLLPPLLLLLLPLLLPPPLELPELPPQPAAMTHAAMAPDNRNFLMIISRSSVTRLLVQHPQACGRLRRR